MQLTREQVCDLTSRKLAAAMSSLGSIKATVGLDGFVDEIIAVVDKRKNHEHYDAVRTIGDLGEKIKAAAGESSNYELVVKQQKIGGNGPIMADALASLGVAVTYVGNLGYPKIHPVFEAMARRMAAVHSIGEPAHTDALEFDDGKLMLGKLTPLEDANWDNLIRRVGKEKLIEIMSGSRLIAMLNWTMLPHMTRVWAQLLDEIIPNVERHNRFVFIDLCDPEKRTADDVVEAMRLLSRFQDQVDVILGLNLKEAVEVADVLGLPGLENPEESLEQLAQSIRNYLKLACVVIHPRRSAAAATETETVRFDGPFVHRPKISTGAGDHFNAGFCLGRVVGFALRESLCLGVATSGYYVRMAKSPTAAELVEFTCTLPPPQQ